MKKLVITTIVCMTTLGLAHGAALGDSYDTFVQALKRPGEPIKQVNSFFNQRGLAHLARAKLSGSRPLLQLRE
jgi:hypothetical protein